MIKQRTTLNGQLICSIESMRQKKEQVDDDDDDDDEGRRKESERGNGSRCHRCPSRSPNRTGKGGKSGLIIHD